MILTGDFNTNWMVPSTPKKLLSEMLVTCNLEPLNFQPIHHDGANPSIIDYVYISDRDQVVS